MTEHAGSTPVTTVCLDIIIYVGCPHTLPPGDLPATPGAISVPRDGIQGRAEAATGQAWPESPLRGLDITDLNGAEPGKGFRLGPRAAREYFRYNTASD